MTDGSCTATFANGIGAWPVPPEDELEELDDEDEDEPEPPPPPPQPLHTREVARHRAKIRIECIGAACPFLRTAPMSKSMASDINALKRGPLARPPVWNISQLRLRSAYSTPS